MYDSPSSDSRAVAIRAAFVGDGRIANHFARAASRYAGRPAWSLILPVTEPGVVARAEALQQGLGEAHVVEPVARDRLHITLDTLAVAPPQGWLEALRSTAAECPVIRVAIGGASAFPESAMLEVLNPEVVRGLRSAIHARHPWLRGDVDDVEYLPHLSIAYFGEDGPAPDVVETIERAQALPPIVFTATALLASRLEFDDSGRSKRLESHSIPLRGRE